MVTRTDPRAPLASGPSAPDLLMLIAVLSDIHDRLDHLQRVLEVDGRKILLTLYPEIGRRLAKSGEADAVFSGHDHQRYQHRFGGALWANPGEIMGRFGVVSFGVYDTLTHAFQHALVPS